MPEHVHLIAYPQHDGYDIADIRLAIKQPVGVKEVKYIHMNPVRRGLVDRVEEWRWSSARWFTGISIPPLIPDPIPPEWIA